MEDEKIFETRGFIMSFWSGIFTALSLSFVLMYFFLMLGLGPILTTLAFIGSLYFMIKGLSGKTIYKVNSVGISQSITPSIMSGFFKKPIEREFTWSEIETAKEGWDLTRGGVRFEYLHLSVSKTPGSLRISDEKKSQSFLEFRTEVLRRINDFNKPIIKHDQYLQENQFIKSFDSKGETLKPIKIKRSFYEKPISKLITIFFVFLTIAILVFSVSFGARATNWFRLLFILIPGTGYMYWRVFKKKK